MREIGIGLIGTGFMGKCHALAYGMVKTAFADVPRPRLEVLCDVPAAAARRLAEQFGFARSTADWRSLVRDPAVDVVAITTPNKLHREMAVGAIEAGKHVHCEKPMGVTLAEAAEMAEAAERAGAVTLVGYNYLRNPAVIHARKLIDEGVIGRVIHFRGMVDEDYMADPETPWSWRCLREQAGLGALGDLGCHLVSIARFLVGPVESLVAETRTVHLQRPRADRAGVGTVENEDMATALLRFTNGVHGVLGTSRTAWGRKNRLAIEVHGERGMILFDQERMNELQLFESAEPRARHGFRTILTGPVHPPYDAFLPAPGHTIGFNEQKAAEVAHLLTSIARGTRPFPDFTEALAVERVTHAIAESGDSGKRVTIGQ